MKQHEREYFISCVRSGIFFLRYRGLTLKVHSPTIEQDIEACRVYNDAYDEAYLDEAMDEGEMFEWMEHKGLWTEEDESRVEGLEKDIEKCKVEIYRARNNSAQREHIRKYIRAGEEQELEMMLKKNQYRANTCEGMAEQAKWEYIIKNCTTLNGELYNFQDAALDYVLSCFRSSILSEGEIRELARSEPWKSLWVVSDKARSSLFYNNDRELTLDQKNLIIWSKMYDNIQESLECPNDDVIDDNDMLDGWFIIQRKKREKEKAEAEFESGTKNEKIKNSPEIFVMTTQDDKSRVENMNDIGGRMTIKQRESAMRQNESGITTQNEFLDEKLKLQRATNKQYKGKFGG